MNWKQKRFTLSEKWQPSVRSQMLEDEDVQIIRSKKVVLEPMYPEDACIQMDLLGADAQISKPEIGQLVGILDSLVASQIYGTNK